MRERRFNAGRRFKVHRTIYQPDHNQRHNGDDFDHKTKTDFTKHFNGGEVEA